MHDKMIVFNPLTGRWKEQRFSTTHGIQCSCTWLWTQLGISSRPLLLVVQGRVTSIRQRSLKSLIPVPQCGPSLRSCLGLSGLNEHLVGIYRNGILYCIAFSEGEDAGRGVLAFSVDEGKWLSHLACPLPNPILILNIVQLVDSNGEIVLFSEIEHYPYSRSQERRIDVLEEVIITNSGQSRGKWRNVTSDTRVDIQVWTSSD